MQYAIQSYTVDSGWKYLYGSLLLFSLISGSIIPIIYMYSPKCRHHPAQIVLILCNICELIIGILEMINCYQFFLDSVDFYELIQFLDNVIGYQKMIKIYTFSKWTIPPYTLCEINKSVILISFLAQLNYYTVLTIDFILTLKKPFLNTKMKLLSYHLFVIALTIIFYSFEYQNVENNCKDYKKMINLSSDNTEIQEWSTYFYVQLATIFLLLCISIYIGINDLRKMKKINEIVRQNRKKLFINHIILITTLLVMWGLPLLMALLSEDIKKNAGLKITRIYFAFMLLHPSILLFIRLRDPYFKSRAYILLGTLICKRKWNENQDKTTDDILEECQLPLNKLVQLQTNQETVSNILSSILRITIYDQQKTDLHKQCKEKRNLKTINHDRFENLDDQPGSPLLWSINFSLKLTLNSKIVEYAPAIFQNLREANQIDRDVFQKSLRLDLNKEQILKTQESLGRSGSFFFYTHDNLLVLKTISLPELQLYNSILEDYFNYVNKQKNTLLTKIYGLYSIYIEGFSQIHLVMMENMFKNMPQQRVVYDLKGSMVNRKTEIKENKVVDVFSSMIQYKPSDEVFKDVNFIKSTDIFIQLKSEIRENLFTVLKDDLEFLLCKDLMDYSLLIGISTHEFGKGERIYNNSQKSYCFGLIDYAQKFTFRKKLEFFYKYHVKRKGDQISCVDPHQYCQRFFCFINSVIAINNKA